jgi:dihydroflavonol-4-reductase
MTEFFERLERLTGVPAPRAKLGKSLNIFGAYALEQVAKWRGQQPGLDPQEVEVGEHWFWLDSSKAERELGFSARDPYETLHETVQYVLAKLPPSELPGTKGRLRELLER